MLFRSVGRTELQHVLQFRAGEEGLLRGGEDHAPDRRLLLRQAGDGVGERRLPGLGHGVDRRPGGVEGHRDDAAGVLLDGTKVEGPAQLTKAFVGQKTQFMKAVTEKLLTYSLGRGLEYYDAPAVRGIVRNAAANDYQWSSLILEIVKSAPFQMRRAGS